MQSRCENSCVEGVTCLPGAWGIRASWLPLIWVWSQHLLLSRTFSVWIPGTDLLARCVTAHVPWRRPFSAHRHIMRWVVSEASSGVSREASVLSVSPLEVLGIISGMLLWSQFHIWNHRCLSHGGVWKPLVHKRVAKLDYEKATSPHLLFF